MNTDFDARAQTILEEIQKAKSVLLHCHPSPDPDSVGSSLAMKFALEQLGKKVMVIRGDSEIPQAFMHFPGAGDIMQKSFSEIDVKEYDLFMILDSSSLDMISKIQTPIFPLPIRTIVIDHHITNNIKADIVLVDASYPATALILFDLFKSWNIELDSHIAKNLFIGTYTDTGAFKYEGVSSKVFEDVACMASYIQDIPDLVARMQNSATPGSIAFKALALSSIRTYFEDTLTLSTVSFSGMKEKNISLVEAHPGEISSSLRYVSQWAIVGSLVEIAPNTIKCSFRTADAKKYDLSRLVVEFGGGGHKAAAGAIIKLPLDEAIKKVVETAKILYNL